MSDVVTLPILTITLFKSENPKKESSVKSLAKFCQAGLKIKSGG
jgi:hypothetical protein